MGGGELGAGGEGDQARESKYYRMTPAGKKHLGAEGSKWKRMAGAIKRVTWPAGEV
jgi:DNA-binding PadR family transcriptional regulator